MQLTDTLFYWLQTKRLTERRPDDGAAQASLRDFAQILSEDHQLESFEIVDGCNDGKVYVVYTVKGQPSRTVWFDREAVEQLANDLYGADAAPENEEA